MNRGWHRVAAAGLLALFLCVPCGAAADPKADRTFGDAVTALEHGAYQEAIDLLELLGDRGFVHPDAAYNRAVAYGLRAKSPDARPGDLGRVAAALTEVLILRPGDADAEQALSRVRQEIARRNARAGATPPLLARPSLSRAVAELVPENVWAALSAGGSGLVTVGLAARLFLVKLFKARLGARARLLANSLSAIGLVVLMTAGPLTVLSRHYRLTSRPAVVVATDARLRVEPGVAIARGSDVIPEGALVYVLSNDGERVRVEWGSARGWIRASQVRLMPDR